METTNNTETTTVWETIFNHLVSKGFTVYSPGTKTGECTAEYVVVKNDGSTQHVKASTDVDLYSIMCYVPQQRYSKLEALVLRVKQAMKELYPQVIPYGSQTPSYYDDNYKAHMISVEYKNYKKMF